MKKYKRKKTKVVNIGQVKIGGNNPIAIQSMTNTDTREIKDTIKQIKKLEREGCEIIRVAVPDDKAVKNIKEIKDNINTMIFYCVRSIINDIYSLIILYNLIL